LGAAFFVSNPVDVYIQDSIRRKTWPLYQII
jgi:uncharacterized PurR-regulated membrane protein YhhQ (DUF165 family)